MARISSSVEEETTSTESDTSACGAELVIHAGELRHRCTVAWGMIGGRGTAAVSDLSAGPGVAGTAGSQRAIKETPKSSCFVTKSPCYAVR